MNADAFLPRSNSKLVVALALGAYSIALERLLYLIIRVFPWVRQSDNTFATHGQWTQALNAFILFPVVAGTVLVVTIELLRLLRLPAVLQIFLAAAASCAINARVWWPLGIAFAPLFLVSGYAYLRWRADSWLVAFAYTVLVIFVSSLPAGISVFQHGTPGA